MFYQRKLAANAILGQQFAKCLKRLKEGKGRAKGGGTTSCNSSHILIIYVAPVQPK